MQLKSRYDVVIVGGGHNGLVSAAYLARAGLSVLVLERRETVGGAAVSERVFPAFDAQLSRFSYLLSMFPQKIFNDLGLAFERRKRPTGMFLPTFRDGKPVAMLTSNTSPDITAESIRRFAGEEGYRGYQRFYELTHIFAQKVWHTMTEPLVSRAEMQRRFDDNAESKAAWEMVVEQPLGQALERYFKDDAMRGVAFTDAGIGVMTHPHDETLLQNRTYIYHVIGNETGEWRVPVGGMGGLTSALAQVARTAGADILTSATVQQIQPGNPGEIEFVHDDQTHTVQGRFVLANVAPFVLAKLIPDAQPDAKPEGTAFKINMLLKRLPRLKVTDITAEQAFTGTFHINEDYTIMQHNFHQASQGIMPDYAPGEIYCHTLTDSSILSPQLAVAGYHTITLFGLHMPYRLFSENNEQARTEALRRYLIGINQYLAEPIEECIAVDPDGRPCIEAKSALDLENEVGLPGGHIFHKDLTWPFAENIPAPGTWGVETAYPNLFICGSGAIRGGCVSGIPGHNAAMKVLECLKSS